MTHEEKVRDLSARLVRALGDRDFVDYCVREKNGNPNFARDFAICEKIARIDINNVSVNQDMLNGGFFNFDEMRDGVVGFYGYLDRLSQDTQPLVPQLMENVKYLTTKVEGRKDTRSCCGTHTAKDGSIEREVFINPEGRIGDIGTAIHEFCHSLSKSFIEAVGRKDNAVAEVSTVITDQLSTIFLKKVFPQYASNFDENLINTQVCNVIKARESLLEGVIMRVAAGDMTMQDAVASYGDMFTGNTNILERCVENIERKDFRAMYEERYLVPQAIALEMADRFLQDPEGTVKQFKEVLSHDTEWDMSEVLDYLGLPQEEVLINNYIAKYHDRVAGYRASQAAVAQDSAKAGEQTVSPEESDQVNAATVEDMIISPDTPTNALESGDNPELQRLDDKPSFAYQPATPIQEGQDDPSPVLER